MVETIQTYFKRLIYLVNVLEIYKRITCQLHKRIMLTEEGDSMLNHIDTCMHKWFEYKDTNPCNDP